MAVLHANAPSRALECPWLSEVTLQGRHIQGGDVTKICQVEMSVSELEKLAI